MDEQTFQALKELVQRQAKEIDELKERVAFLALRVPAEDTPRPPLSDVNTGEVF